MRPATRTCTTFTVWELTLADPNLVPPDEPVEAPPSSGSWLRWLMPYGPRMYDVMPALSSRDFRIFWAGQMVSLSGTWVQSVAQQWLVLKLTHSALALGLVTTVQFTPLLLLSLVGGAISDRVPKRNLLLATQIISGILAGILAILVYTGVVTFWQVLIIAGILGTVNAFYVPARQAFVPELVDKDALLNAVALNSAIFNGARVIGPALGGVLIAVVGLALNFALNALSYVAVIVGLWMIKPRPVEQSTVRPGIWRTVREGLDYILATPIIYTILALVGFTSLFALNFTTLMPVMAQQVLHVGSEGFGFLMASLGIGSLIGAIALAFFNRSDHARRFIYTGLFAFTAIEIAFGLSRNYIFSVALLLLLGFFSTLFTTTSNTRVLSLTPANLQGRVMSVYSLMFLGMTPFGSLLSGVVAQQFGAPVAVVAGGAITLAFAVGVLAWDPPMRYRRRTEKPTRS